MSIQPVYSVDNRQKIPNQAHFFVDNSVEDVHNPPIMQIFTWNIYAGGGNRMVRASNLTIGNGR